MARPAVGFSAAAADVNADGRADIYVASYNHYGRVTPDSWFRATNGRPNLLFLSEPGRGYREAAADWGVADGRWSYAAAFADVNDDGHPDLYVANDFLSTDLLYLNNADGTFTNRSAELLKHQSFSSMGVDIADFDNDARVDIVVLDMLPKDPWRQRVRSNTAVALRIAKYSVSSQYNESALE